MTEDLHDIDDLFRDGLKGHEEEVPSDVWRAVSSDLDKKQASYYKHKYYRLKYAAALLLLLCVVGAVYLTFHVVNDRHTNKIDSKTAGKVPVSSQQEKQRGEATSTVEQNHLQQPVGQSGTAVTESTPLMQGNNSNAIVPDTKETEQVISKNETSDEDVSFVSPNTFNFKSTKRRGFVSKEAKTSLPVTRAVAEKSLTDQPLTAAKEIFDLKYFSLPPKDLSLPVIDPRIFSQTLFPNLPQKKSAGAKAIHGFTLSAFVAPNLSFDRLEDDDHLAGPGRNRREAHRDEQKNNSFSGGLLVNYGLSSKLSLQSGVTVTSSSTAIAPKTVYAKADNNGHTRYELHCSSGYVYISPEGSAPPVVGDSAKTTGTTSRLVYVGIPVALRYEIQLGRLSLSPMIGAGLNLLASGKTSTNLLNTRGNESTTAAISGLKSSYVDGQIGIGIEYGLSKRFSLGVRPNARLALTPINRETPVKSYQNFLSVETGVRVKL